MNKQLHRLAATAALACAGLLTGTSAHAADVAVDVTGINSFEQVGAPANTVLFVNIGANALVTWLSWDVTLQAFAPSSVDEMQVSLGSGASQLDIPLTAFSSFTGTAYTGTLDLTGLGVAAGADGQLRIEFSETFKDLAPGVADGQWLSGQLTMGVSAVPEPASTVLAVIGLAVVAGAGRRQRR